MLVNQLKEQTKLFLPVRTIIPSSSCLPVVHLLRTRTTATTNNRYTNIVIRLLLMRSTTDSKSLSTKSLVRSFCLQL